MRRKIGERLVQAGLITNDDLKAALAEHKRTGERLGMVLVRMNLAIEKQIAKALALQLGFPYVDLADNPPDPALVALIPREVALNRLCIAIALEGNVATVAMSDPMLFSLVQDLEHQIGYRINQVVATRGDILDAIRNRYPDETPPGATHGDALPSGDAALPLRAADEPLERFVRLDSASGSAPLDDLADFVVKSAVKSQATDVHVEPTEEGVLIRHRVDGVLRNVVDLPKWVHDGLIVRVKTMAGMDAAEKRLPQGGRFRVTADDGSEVDFQTSTVRTLFGEKIVMRMLDRRKSVPDIEDLGMSATALEAMRTFLGQQHGMILVVGPTGSGKSTTLAAALETLQSEGTNVITIEDPVEYQVPGVNQTQIDEKMGLTFATALRAILGQDPDVILVGEIRDAETAKLAIQAGETGQLVLSTLPTDDAASAPTRLIEIGTEPYLVAGSLVGVVAQRLVRRLCVHCRRQYTPPAEAVRRLNISETEASTIVFYEAVGCDECSHTGYRGRIGLYEVMEVTDKLRPLIAARAPESQLRDAAIAAGMVTLGEDGLAKMKSGMTTAEELLRVLTEVRDVRTLCPACGTAVGVDFIACPQCGERINAGCPRCGRSVQAGWNFCPYCANGTEETRSHRRWRDRGASGAMPLNPRRELPRV